MSTALPASHEVVTVPEAMTALRLSRSKIYDLIRSGVLRSYTEGRARRIPAEALQTYIHNKLEEAA
ncbi:helix-turn-helix domain-containing protein [Streptomyces sp. ASQP_92]|uniref:helix-turn-helix domain-containing protein n=1 Tax=Streptomyces sp. ASQP_92 TaxID=2979116 RepID=UPI0021C0C4DA|nr:helix-turn-helix domain-containing protein [Streptomyces sp. ASQP_92]MCT9090487.1 helix-turn-helix domain-containing protein [Streptomyces sp. ASQP_92]